MSTSNHVPRITLLLVVLACAFVSTVQAQIWQGPASLEIRAEGKGASVGGGTVELVYLALDPPAGPPPVPLDSRGRAVVNGLAEGKWRVSVAREGFMTYQPEVARLFPVSDWLLQRASESEADLLQRRSRIIAATVDLPD